MLAATIFGHFFNYLFHFVTGRFLPPDQYGLLESFLALNYFLAVIISSFSLSVIKTVNRLDFKQLQRLSFKLTLITWLAFLLLYPLLSYLLKFNQPYLFLIFSLQILFAFTPTLYVAIIQAKLRFKQLALLNFLSPFIKTLTAFILLFLGLKISGAIAGLVVSGLLTAGLSYWLVRPYLTITAQKNSNNLTAFWSASRLSFITQLGLTSLYVSDILLVRFFFPADLSGIYAAVSVIGKIIFFISATVLTVSFPVFVTQKTQPIKLKNSFFQAAALIGLIGLAGLIGYRLFPNWIIYLLYGLNYQSATLFLFPFAVFMVILAFFNLNLQFLLALSQKSAGWLAGLTAICQLGLIIIHHQSLLAIIQNSILAVSAGLIFSLIFTLKYFYAKI
mgnify:CR=1 FL=1